MGGYPDLYNHLLACIMRLVYSIATCLLLVGCSECDIINVTDHPSPDGKHVATLYGADYYNTTGHSTYVDLHRTGKRMRHPGNVIGVGPGDIIMSLTWASSTQFVVGYFYEVSRLGPAATNMDGVLITFRKETPSLERSKK